ncbi:MAG: YfbU family protein [Pseudomonadota bacterium]
MQMSDGEKLIAMMLADLMRAGKISGEIDPDFVIEAIAGDDLWALKDRYHGLFHNDGPSDDEVNETYDILEMARAVEFSIDRLSDEEKAEIEENDRQVFIGFDGNHDPHLGVPRMAIEKLNKWQEFSERPLNCHHTILPRYRRQIQVFEHIKRTERRNGPWLSLNQIQRVLAA